MKKNPDHSKPFNLRNYLINSAAGLSATVASLLPMKADAQTPEQIRNVQQEFSNKSKVEQLETMYRWYSNEVNDSLQMVAFGNNKVYHDFNATLQTNPASGMDVLKKVPGESYPYVALTMVGKSGARFSNENSFHRDYTTTFPSMFNMLKTNDETSKKVLSLYTGWKMDDISIIRDDDGQVVNTKYSGPSERHIIRPRTVESKDLANKVGETVEHTRWMPGTTALFPLENVLGAMGYDIQLADDLNKKHQDYNMFILALETALADKDTEIEKLTHLTDSLELVNDSAAMNIQYLDDALKQWNLGVDIGINSDFVPKVGLYGTFSNKLGIGMSHTLQSSDKTGSTFERLEDKPPEGRPTSGTYFRETTTDSFVDNFRVLGELSYRLTNNLSVGLGAGVQPTKYTTNIVDRFGIERPGPDGEIHVINEKLEDPFSIVDKKNYFVGELGVRVNIPNSRIGFKGDISTTFPDFKYTQGSLGVTLNINKHNGNNYNNRQTQNR